MVNPYAQAVCFKDLVSTGILSQAWDATAAVFSQN
jgi:hypothetical protein